MADINLLQNQLKDTTNVSKKRSQIVVVLSTIVLLALLAAGALLYFLTKKINDEISVIYSDNQSLQQQINSGDSKLAAAKVYQAQLSNLEALLKKHVSITPFLEELSNFTFQRAKFISMDVDQNLGKIHVEGSVESYENLGKLLLGLSTSSNFTKVKLNSVSSASTQTANDYVFSLDLIVSPKLFVNQP